MSNSSLSENNTSYSVLVIMVTSFSMLTCHSCHMAVLVPWDEAPVHQMLPFQRASLAVLYVCCANKLSLMLFLPTVPLPRSESHVGVRFHPVEKSIFFPNLRS